MTDFQLGFAEVLIQPMVLLLLGFNTNYKDYLITAMKCQNIELQLNWILLFWNNLFEISSLEVVSCQPDDLSDIDIWMSMSIIYFQIQVTEKYITAMC